MKRILCVWLVACGPSGAVEPDVEPVVVGGAETTSGEETEVQVSRDVPGIARALGPNATFADLVTAIRRLDDRSEGASEERCVLRGGARAGDGFRFEAELAVPLRPIPEPSPSLVARLRTRAPVKVIAVWGQRGEGNLVLAALTLTTPRRGREVVAFVSEDGARLRLLDAEISEALAGPHTPESLSAWLSSQDGDAGIGRVLITADAGLSLVSLRRFLAAIPPSLEVAIAVPLAADVRLPDAPAPPSDDVGLCTSEPEWASDDPGEVDVTVLRNLLRERNDDFAECLMNVAPERAQGGRLGIRFRIERDGTVARACASSDAIGDPRVRACVLEVFRRVRVAAPSPAGVVDVELPLTLVPHAADATRALCE